MTARSIRSAAKRGLRESESLRTWRVCAAFHRTTTPDGKRVGRLSYGAKNVCFVCLEGLHIPDNTSWRVEPAADSHVLGNTRLGTGMHCFNPFVVLVRLGLRGRLLNSHVVLGRAWARDVLACEGPLVVESNITPNTTTRPPEGSDAS